MKFPAVVSMPKGYLPSVWPAVHAKRCRDLYLEHRDLLEREPWPVKGAVTYLEHRDLFEREPWPVKEAVTYSGCRDLVEGTVVLPRRCRSYLKGGRCQWRRWCRLPGLFAEYNPVSLLLPHPDCCWVRVLVVGVLVFPFCLDSGGMNVLSINGKRSSIDLNQL